MKSIIRTSEWLSVIAPMTLGTSIREIFAITQEPASESGFATDDDHEQDTFYRRPSLWSH